ncbi:MAG: SGNH/GDSL hydrolase family protein [Candidatus Omnitrophica bacterium]|nr:SGNH/GDSL hydrolase family protein [Candidatus Omnitrophota bacterium]
MNHDARESSSQKATALSGKLSNSFRISFFILGVSVFLIAAVEMVLSITEGSQIYTTSMRKMRMICLREHPPGGRFSIQPDADYLQKTDSLDDKIYKFDIDERGFIQPSRVYEDPDVEMVFLGGSTTECMYVSEDKRFPYLAGRNLSARTGKKINAYNGGVSGNHSLHSIDVLLHKALPMRPAAVLLLHNVNDLNILLYEGGYWNSNPTRSLIEDVEISEGEEYPTLLRRMKNIVRYTIPHLYRRAFLLKKQWRRGDESPIGNPQQDEFAHLRGRKIQYDEAFMRREFRRNLEWFVDIVRDSGSTPILMTQANRFTGNPDKVVRINMMDLEDMGIGFEEYKELYDGFNQIIRDVGEDKEARVIDLERMIPKESRYMYDTMHFNDEGSIKAAEIIAAHLLDLFAEPEL